MSRFLLIVAVFALLSCGLQTVSFNRFAVQPKYRLTALSSEKDLSQIDTNAIYYKSYIGSLGRVFHCLYFNRTGHLLGIIKFDSLNLENKDFIIDSLNVANGRFDMIGKNIRLERFYRNGGGSSRYMSKLHHGIVYNIDTIMIEQFNERALYIRSKEYRIANGLIQ